MEKTSLLLLKKKILWRCPVDEILSSPDHKFDNKLQQGIVDHIFRDKEVQAYPINLNYQLVFLKKLLQKLQDNGESVYEELFELYCSVLFQNNISPTHYRHLLVNCDNNENVISRIVIEEHKNIISQGTTGLCSWQAAELIAEWCIANKNQIHDKNLLELGSGIGLTGITVLKTSSPKTYTFSDCHPVVLELLKKNVQLNFPLSVKNKYNNNIAACDKCNTDTAVIDLAWESINKVIEETASWIFPDVVLAADVVYDSTIFGVLINALRALLRRDNSYAIIGITVRNYETLANFLQELENSTLQYKEEQIPNFTIFFPPKEPVKIIKIFR